MASEVGEAYTPRGVERALICLALSSGASAGSLWCGSHDLYPGGTGWGAGRISSHKALASTSYTQLQPLTLTQGLGKPQLPILSLHILSWWAAR